MKITSSIESAKSEPGLETTTAARGGATAKAGAAAASVDKIELSDVSRALAASSVAKNEDIRTDKVHEVKSALDSGKYQVAAQVVAEKMIREAASLLKSMVSSGGSGKGKPS